MKELIKRIPIWNNLIGLIRTNQRIIKEKKAFKGSRAYWQKRYSTGGDSGVGSYGKFAKFKAEVINEFIDKHGLRSVIEFGCGDGNQLTLASYKAYFGYDVSETAINKCKRLFSGDASKHFLLMDEYKGEKADVALSLDVIYHLVEDGVFEKYTRTLFDFSTKFVIIYASNMADNAENEDLHIKHRIFTKWLEHNITNWRLLDYIPNKYPYKGDYKQGSFSDFFIYAKD